MLNEEDLAGMTDEALLLALEETDESEHVPILAEQRRRAVDRGENGEAASLSFRIGELAKSQGNKKLLARAKYDEGSSLYDNDEYSESAQRFDDAATLYKELGNQKSATNSLYWKASALLLLDNEEESVQAAEEAKSFAEQENDYALIGRSLFVKGKGLFYLKRHDEALPELLDAVENLAIAGLANEVANVYEFLGRTLYNLDRNRDSINYLQKASIIIQNGIDEEVKKTIPELKRKISLNYYQLNEHAKCIELLEEARKEFQDAGRIDDVAFCEFDIGDSLQELDRQQESLDYFLRAETLAESVGNKRLAYRALHYRGISHHNLGNYEEALNLYKRLWDQTNESKEFREFASFAYNRSLGALNYLERYQEVVERYEKAPKWDDFTPEPNDRLVMMAHYCKALFEVGSHDAALRIASQGISESESGTWNVAIATFFEIRSKLTRESQPERSEQDLSFAISLLLASDWVQKAKELSDYFVSKAGEINKEKSIESNGE